MEINLFTMDEERKPMPLNYHVEAMQVGNLQVGGVALAEIAQAAANVFHLRAERADTPALRQWAKDRELGAMVLYYMAGGYSDMSAIEEAYNYLEGL